MPRHLSHAVQMGLPQRMAWYVECKVLHKDPERTIEEGLAQTRGYMDRCGAESGHLIVFDRAPDRTWEERIFRRETPAGGGAPVTVWGM